MATAKKYKNYTDVNQLPCLCRAHDCAAFMGISLQTVYEIFNSNKIKVIKIGNRKMVQRKEFLRFLDSIAE